ncbi:MAG: polynucleotide adenylyltransferase [Desulfovibrionaceae bacterium]|nr:polynucleotide adenylyltransferase [Desulfovibrionaceae bacterium]
MRQYIVGGAVRDLLLGRVPHDCDMAFSGAPDEFLQKYARARKVGRSVETYLLDGVEYMPLRGGTVDADLAARDLTVNALALEENGVLHVHPSALADLKTGLLRPASSTALRDDPVRIFRTARFAAQFPEFTVHETFFQQAHEVFTAGTHLTLPAERVGREVLKALESPSPSRFLLVLAEGNLLSPWLMELDGADAIPAGPARWHSDTTLLAHICRVMDAVAGDPLAVWMALCHDLGKVLTPTEMLPHHYGHEARGVEPARQLALRLALPARYARAGEVASREHMKGGIYATLRTGTRRDLLHRVHSSGLDEPFWKLADADSGRQPGAQAREELACMLGVRLPPQWRDRGAVSGEHRRMLQCEAINALRRPLP